MTGIELIILKVTIAGDSTSPTTPPRTRMAAANEAALPPTWSAELGPE